MPSPTRHAILAPSASKRWLTCTPSARLDERLRQRYGEQESPDAQEGTKAHALGELKIRYSIWRADKMTAAKHGAMSAVERELYPGINANRYKALRSAFGDIPADMETATDTYADVVLERLETHKGTRQLFLEQRVDISDWAPECSGTSDCIIVSDDLLEIIDYKNGRTDGMGHSGMPVEAEGNTQLRLYALGAAKLLSALYDFKAVRYCIVQPHLNSVTREAMSLDDLLAWGESIKPNAAAAFKGEGEFVPGPHCHYCAAKSVCAARAAQALKVFDYGLAGSGELSQQQILDILPKLDAAEEWIKDIREYTESRAVAGQKYSGYKLVQGRRPNRKWKDDNDVRAQLLRNGYGPEQFEETKLKAVGDIEKTLGKTSFRALLGDLVVQGEAPLKLVPEDDPRPEYNSADAAFADMAETTKD